MPYIDKIDLFENVPIKKAALHLIIPTVISQLVMLIYNMADTWFIGQTGDARQVAAVTITYPLFMVMNGIANLFGIGGSSLLSRKLGQKEYKKTQSISAYILWISASVTIIYSIVTLLFSNSMLHILNANPKSIPYAQQYLFWTVVIGGVGTVLNLVLANIIRAEGEAKVASIGMALGGFLNMFMDPIFIFSMKMGVAGAALSTCISNYISLFFLLCFILKNKERTLIKIPLFFKKLDFKSQKEIYSIGTPAALQILLAALSNAILLRLMSHYSIYAISGMGVMQKLESIPFQAIMGISDGIIPLVAYNYASKNIKRMNEAISFALKQGLLWACIFFSLCEILAPSIVHFFINDVQSVQYGSAFVRLRTLALPFITIEFMLIAIFQGIGSAKQALFLSIFRKGIIDLPLMVLANIIWPMYGLMLVQPFMEFSGSMIAIIMYKKLRRKTT